MGFELFMVRLQLHFLFHIPLHPHIPPGSRCLELPSRKYIRRHILSISWCWMLMMHRCGSVCKKCRDQTAHPRSPEFVFLLGRDVGKLQEDLWRFTPLLSHRGCSPFGEPSPYFLFTGLRSIFSYFESINTEIGKKIPWLFYSLTRVLPPNKGIKTHVWYVFW